MGRKKQNRKQASRYIPVIDNLLEVIDKSKVTKVVVASLVDVEYVTLDKYLRKERNINNEDVVKRMIVTTDLLNNMVAKGILPIPNEINSHLRSSVIFELIDDFISSK